MKKGQLTLLLQRCETEAAISGAKWTIKATKHSTVCNDPTGMGYMGHYNAMLSTFLFRHGDYLKDLDQSKAPAGAKEVDIRRTSMASFNGKNSPGLLKVLALAPLAGYTALTCGGWRSLAKTW